jgi:hypothetical protein
MMMLAMEQLKTSEATPATRLASTWGGQVIVAWLCVAFDETIESIGHKLGPIYVRVDACDPDIVAKMLPSPS